MTTMIKCGCNQNNNSSNEFEACFGSVEITDGIQQEKTVEPSTEQQVVEPDEDYTSLSKVTVEAVDASIDANIQPQNIRKGVRILNVEGTAEAGSGGSPSVEVDDITLLPSVGQEGYLYVIKNENAIYRWDDSLVRYVAVARDYNEIEVISCGTASEEYK